MAVLALKSGIGQPFWELIWIYYYLLNRIELDLDLHNSCSIQKYLANFATNNINVWFVTQHTLSEFGESSLTVFLTA